ncbi:phage baseplate assembly protein V [Streptomyces sp. NPDC002758]
MSADPVLGMYRASVANNQDPLNEARVTLLIPQVLGNAESAWAAPSSPTNTIPPIGQTLWVQFSGGDITKPVYSPLGIKDVQDAVGELPTDGGLDPMPPKQPTALTLTTVQYVTNEGATRARVTASWTPPTENQDGTALTDLSHYLLQTSYDNSNWSGGFVTTEDLVLLDGLNTGVTLYVRVAAFDTSSNTSLWASANITTASASTPPPVPSAPGVVGALGGLRVTWDGKDNTGTAMPAIFSYVQVQRDTTSAFSNPVVIGTLPGPDFLYDSIQNYASAYFYRLVAYSKVGIASAPSGSNSDTPKQAVAQDILDASLTAAKIAVGAIDDTKLAANAVTTQAIANGAVAAGKLAALAVGTTNIANNAVTGTQLADATIGSAKIINGAIGNAQIADAAINNAKISDLDAGKINVGTLNAARIATGSLDASKITAGTLTATQILAGSITGDRLAANTITANQMAANTITANQMAAGTITAQSGVIASIDASKITVGKISATQIDATNLVITGGNVSGTVASATSATTATTATSATSASSSTTVTGSIGAGVSVPAGQLSNGTIPTTTTISGGSIKTGTIDASLVSVTNLDANSIKAGTLTVDKLSAGLQATVGQKFYDFGNNAAKWLNSSTGTMTTVAVTDAASGGYIMRCAGYIQGAYRPDLLIPFDPTVTYRVTCRVRQTVDNSTPGTNQNFYAGVTGIAADGVTLVNASGSNAVSSQHYVAAKGVSLTTGGGWVTYTGYIKGVSATPTGGSTANIPTAPATLHQNVKYISPCLYLNYTGGTGTAELDVFTIEVVETGQVGSANINLGNVAAQHITLGTITGNLVTNGGLEDTSKTGWTLAQSDNTLATTAAKIEVGEGGYPARSGQGKLTLGVKNTGTATGTSTPFQVVAGATYMFRYWYYGIGHLHITFETSPDKVTWTDQMASANDVTYNAATYVEDLFEVTIPAGAVWARVSFQQLNPGSYGLSTTAFSYICVDDILVMREGFGATDISAGGIRLFAEDGTLATELTTDNAHATFAGGKASIDPNGVGTFNSVWTPQRPAGASSDDPTGQIWYQGKELSDLLWNMPWGMVTYERGWTNKPTSTTYYTTETGLIELAFTAVEGRMYRIVARSQFDFNGGTGNQVLENRVNVAATAATVNGCTIWSPTGASPRVTDPIVCRHFGMYYDGAGTDGTTTTEGIIVCSADAGGLYSSTTALAPGDHRILWTATQHSGNATGWGLRNYSPAQSSDFYVEDIGPALPENGVYNTGGAAVTATKTYTKTYSAVWSRRFGNAGSTDGSMYQGYYSGTWGTQKSMVGFGAQPYTDMGSTAKVSKVEIYLYANHWYYNGGGTAHIGAHTQLNVPSGSTYANNLTVASWPVGAGKWVTLPSSWNSTWNAATPYRGITLGGDLGSSTDKTYYGIFDGVGDSHPPQLRITYTK